MVVGHGHVARANGLLIFGQAFEFRDGFQECQAFGNAALLDQQAAHGHLEFCGLGK